CVACFFHRAATSAFYTLSLHDALPICVSLTLSAALTIVPSVFPIKNQSFHAPWRARNCRTPDRPAARGVGARIDRPRPPDRQLGDRKSTRLNSSHVAISYAVFCLKKKR